jgi:hypoxanthine phosphoribosyltransferase
VGLPHPDIEEVLVDAPALDARIAELAAEIDRDYAGRTPLLVGVLRGSIVFLGMLLRRIREPVQVDCIAISSYGAATRSLGVVRLLKDLEEDVAGRDVIIVEDIVDTGLTLAYLRRVLRERAPASIEVCTLLNKPARRLVDLGVRYVGFTIPDKFVVGFGLDFAQRYRNLDCIAVLKPHVYQG